MSAYVPGWSGIREPSAAAVNALATLNIGGGDVSQDTNNTVSAFDAALGTFTVTTNVSAQPRNCRRDMTAIQSLYDATAVSQIVEIKCTYTVLPTVNGLCRHGMLLLDDTPDANILTGLGLHFNGAATCQMFSVNAGGIAATLAGISPPYATMGGWVGDFTIVSGRVIAANLTTFDVALSSTATIALAPSIAVTSGSLRVAVFAGISGAFGAAQNVQATTQYSVRPVAR